MSDPSRYTSNPCTFRIEPLSGTHECERFDCGEESLNRYLIDYARWNAKLEIGKTYALVREGEATVIGYYTIAVGSLQVRDVPKAAAKRLPRYPVPVIRLGRLACDRTVQGQRLGSFLLMDALIRAGKVSREIAVYAVEVDALNDVVRAFYTRYGFESLLDDPLHMYLPIKTIRTIL